MSRALLVQHRPAARVYKLAWLLRKLGHSVCIAHGARRPLLEEHAWLAQPFLHVPIA